MPPSAGYDANSAYVRAQRYFWRIGKRVRERLRRRVPREHILVAGSQRSGTNMVMYVMQWCIETQVIHETDSRAFVNYEMRPLNEIQALARRSFARFFVIKSLCELDRLDVLMDGLAPAKTLWIVRNFNDSVRSMTRSFEKFADQLQRLTVDKAGAGWRGRGMSDETQALLRHLYRPDMNEASAAALMWYYRNVLFFERGLDQDPRVSLVFYEDLVKAPNAEFKRVFESLGIPGWTPWITRTIHSHSVQEVPYEAILPEVKSVCEALYERFRAARPT
jgi:hypothetical protein